MYLFTSCGKNKSQLKTKEVINQVMILKAIFKHYLSSASKYIPFYNSTYPGGIHLFQVSNGNIGTMSEICSKLTIKTLNIFHNLLWCFLD